jgi:hypothetical protein
VINETGGNISKESTNVRGEMIFDGHYLGTDEFCLIYRVAGGL